ncbi:MAG: hypothetical protein GXP31_11765 [Kiritimatiellaeota bacterium]|nr:hypothetical protein [Kiritimatiellota bacterium]
MKNLSLSLTALLLAAVAAAEDNLLPNGGFEQGDTRPLGWGFVVWSRKPSRGRFTWSTDARSGARASRLTGLENAGGEAVRSLIYSDPIQVRPGLYKLAGQYRTAGDARAQLQVLVYSEPVAKGVFSTPPRSKWSRNLPLAPAWSGFDFDLNLSPGVRRIVVLLRETDIGDVDFDDVSLTPVEDALTLRVYPAEYGRGGVVPLVRNAPSFMRVMLMGDRKRLGPGAEIQLDLPEGLGEFGLLERLGPITREKQPYTRFRIPLGADIAARLKATVSHCGLTIWLDPKTVQDGAALYCRPVVAGKVLAETRVRLRVLQPLPVGPRPKRFHNFFCWGLFGNVPKRLRGSVYDMVRNQMGVDIHLVSRAENSDWLGYLRDRFAADGGRLWANIPGAYPKAMRRTGWETEIVKTGKPFFARDAGYYRALAGKVSGVFWDWEPANAVRNPLWDDPATVNAFAEREGLDPKALTAPVLQRNGPLKQRFLEFRTWQLGQTMRLWAEYVHDIDPDWTVAICQGSGMPPERHVDYRAYADIPNLLHIPMIYTGSAMAFARNVSELREYLPEARIMPMTSTGMVADSGWLMAKTPRAVYFDFITSALLGCAGCSHWPNLERGFDMEYVWETARAMRDIGAVESFLFDGERNPTGVDVRLLPEAEATIQTGRGTVRLISPQWERYALSFVYKLGRRTLVAVCNLHEVKPATVEVRVPRAAPSALFAHDPITGKVLAPSAGGAWTAEQLRSGLYYEVPPRSLGMLVLGPERPAAPGGGRVSEQAVRKRYQARRRAAEASGDIRGLSKGGLEIGWADMDGDGNAEIRLASAGQELGFGPSGNLWSWRVGKERRELVSRFDGGGACVDQFWWPEGARTSEDKTGEYELIAREIKGGRATLVFRRVLSHWALGGLVLEKAYSIPRDATRLDVRVTVRNESPEPHEFSYWSHNCLDVGGTPSLLLRTSAGEKLFAGEKQPREIWARLAGLSAAQQGLLRDTDLPELTASIFRLGSAAGPRIEIRTDPARFLQLYRWWDGTTSGRYTVEWMYRKQKLETHKSWSTTFSLTVSGVDIDEQ